MKPSCAPGQSRPGPAARETRGAELPVTPRPGYPPVPAQSPGGTRGPGAGPAHGQARWAAGGETRGPWGAGGDSENNAGASSCRALRRGCHNPRTGGELSLDRAVSPSRAGLSAIRPHLILPPRPQGSDSPCPPCPASPGSHPWLWEAHHGKRCLAGGDSGICSGCRGKRVPRVSLGGSDAGAVRGKGDSAAFPALKFHASCSILLRRR